MLCDNEEVFFCVMFYYLGCVLSEFYFFEEV